MTSQICIIIAIVAYLGMMIYIGITYSKKNTQAAESRIRDADIADLMMEYSVNNIIMQAGTSMLTQANQSSQSILELLQ